MLDTPEELEKFTRAVIDKIKAEMIDELIVPRRVPATVSGVTLDGMVVVAIDGDEVGVTTRVEPLTGDLLREGQRVIVTFQPGGACGVTDVIQSGFGPVALVKDGTPSDDDYPFTPPDGTIAMDRTNSRIYVRSGGVWMYEILT